ncbi:hypothetical protein BC628DRAFT_1418054 [Trametes gibbosa]|nr:hypothetical protein BC628DRAFT_1418045 [Trametes gibbosa]KAI0827958.1 hypothetical protein BC628DRAFT_1418054 [Trametes gibbosa]
MTHRSEEVHTRESTHSQVRERRSPFKDPGPFAHILTTPTEDCGEPAPSFLLPKPGRPSIFNSPPAGKPRLFASGPFAHILTTPTEDCGEPTPSFLLPKPGRPSIFDTPPVATPGPVAPIRQTPTEDLGSPTPFLPFPTPSMPTLFDTPPASPSTASEFSDTGYCADADSDSDSDYDYTFPLVVCTGVHPPRALNVRQDRPRLRAGWWPECNDLNADSHGGESKRAWCERRGVVPGLVRHGYVGFLRAAWGGWEKAFVEPEDTVVHMRVGGQFLVSSLSLAPLSPSIRSDDPESVRCI